MAKLKLHIERVPLDLVKKKLVQHAAAVNKQNESSTDSDKGGRKPKAAIKNLRAR